MVLYLLRFHSIGSRLCQGELVLELKRFTLGSGPVRGAGLGLCRIVDLRFNSLMVFTAEWKHSIGHMAMECFHSAANTIKKVM